MVRVSPLHIASNHSHLLSLKWSYWMLAEPNPSRQKPQTKLVPKSRVGVELALYSEKGQKGAQKRVTQSCHTVVFGLLDRSKVLGSLADGTKQKDVTEFHPSDAS